MKNNLKIAFLANLLLFVGMPAYADIYFENLTNQNINIKFKVCIEKNVDANATTQKSSVVDSKTTQSEQDENDDKPTPEINCKRDQDFEASIGAGYRAKTKFDNITVTAVNLSSGDKYSSENSLESKKGTCVAEYKGKDQVIRFWLKDIKTAKQVVVCKSFEDKPLETVNSDRSSR